MRPNCTLPLLTAALASLITAAASAQASYQENFDGLGATTGTGPDSLVAGGWEFRNQSAPTGPNGWYDGWLFAPYNGPGYLAVDELSTAFLGGDVSTWAILPAIPDQVAGDAITFQVQGSVVPQDRLELRYSPSGSTSTGAGAADVGDFTVLLADVDLQTGGWTKVTAALPGTGRIALRYAQGNACNFPCTTSSIGIDELSVGPTPPPPCNLPPLPLAGETVHWTQAGGPWVVCSDLLIPTGGRVVVDAGAALSVDPGFTLTVNGELEFQGTASARVGLLGATHPFGTPPVRVQGHMTVSHADVGGLLYCAHGGTLEVRDSSFEGAGVWTANLVGGPDHDTTVLLERCSVDGADIYVEDGTLVARDVTVVGAGIGVSRGYSYLENVSVDGGPVSIYRQQWAQPGYLNDLSVTNSPVGGLVLDGSDFWVGPDNVLLGNLAPVQLTGGLLGGSSIPTSGNSNDYVDTLDGSAGGPATWGKVDVPYVVNGIGTGGPSRIEAGVTVKFAPGTGFLYQGGLKARGTASDPIRFEPLVPGQNWQLFKFQSASGTIHLEHAAFDQSDRALQSDNSVVYADSCVFTNNAAGAWVNTFGLFKGRNCRFLGNGIGAHLESGQLEFNGATNPNSFVGNGVAIDGGTGNARFNWWGAASGPQHASNPGGTGDPVAGTVPVLPFLTNEPDYSDAPPQVTILAGPALVLEGRPTIVKWRVAEDSGLLAQRIEYSPVSNVNFTKLVDLPPKARSWEFVAPKGPTGSQGYSFLRVVAVDDAGQEAWDEVSFSTPYVDDVPGGEPSITFLSDFSGGYTMGEQFAVDYTYTGSPASMEADIVLDSDQVTVDQGGFPASLGTWEVTAPYASTDQARVVLTVQHGNNRFFRFFSEPFSIRPHALVPDQPPQVALLSPAPGRVFAGGTRVPFKWGASDDEALREIRVQANFTGNYWVTLAILDPDATSWSYRLPDSKGIDDVGLRVVAVDERFQNSSATTRIDITPTGGGLPGNTGGEVVTQP